MEEMPDIVIGEQVFRVAIPCNNAAYITHDDGATCRFIRELGYDLENGMERHNLNMHMCCFQMERIWIDGGLMYTPGCGNRSIHRLYDAMKATLEHYVQRKQRMIADGTWRERKST